ncbi:heme/hemin ABC transporter substrate-binding protein [Vibrio taketomensis]|uniref:heme/hemin ABC transporter substrate-binding protein n=1 Tax=Vibrio taketomensis TaxID=2572923 RepID=UPI001389A31F|nr:ABC transporter substrate-binding protein [Vibrio taketomensis]
MKKLVITLGLLVASLPSFAQTEPTPNRIISAGSSITELIVALGAKDQLVALDVTSKHFNTDGKLPQVGYHRQLSPEGLMALMPTHLIGSKEMGPETTLSLLKSGGVTVETVPSGDSEQDLFKRIDAIAQITHTQPKAQELKASLETKLDMMRERKLERAPKTIFTMLSKGRPATVAGDKTTIDAIISLAGGTNPAKAELSSYKQLSQEAIVDMQPAYILVSQRDWDKLGGEQGIIKEYPLFMATPAAINHRIIPVQGSAIIGGLGIESLELADSLYQNFSQSQ